MVTAKDVLEFWFGTDAQSREERRKHWFARSDAFDEEIRQRFGDALKAASRGDLDGWGATARGRLALVLLLDQMPRNAYRGTGRAFSLDDRALHLVREGLSRGEDQGMDADEATFFFLPLEHSESLTDQNESVERFRALCQRAPAQLRKATHEALSYAKRHRDIIQRFGRFPHRNKLLGRSTTEEEARFLKEPNSSF